MAFGLDDLVDWIRDLVDQGSNAVNVVNGSAPLTSLQSVNKNVEQGIIDPGKMLSEFSGLAQGYRGAMPTASNMDRGLALLALSGVLSGAGDDAVRLGLKEVKTTKPKYVYGFHVDSRDAQQIGKKIKPIVDAESRYGKGAAPNMNAFFGFGETPNQIPDKAFENAIKWATSYDGGSASLVKTKAKNVTKDPRSSVGWRTPKDLKVVKSSPYRFSDDDPYWREWAEEGDIILTRKLLKELVRKTKATR